MRHLEPLRRPTPAVHLQTPTLFLLTSRDAAVARFLEEVMAERPRGIVLKMLEEAPRRVKGLHVGYDVLDIKRDLDSEVTHVRRCTVVRDGQRLLTRNMEIVLDRVPRRRICELARLDAGVIKITWVNNDPSRKATVTYQPNNPTFDLRDLFRSLEEVVVQMDHDLLWVMGVHSTPATDEVLEGATRHLLILAPGIRAKT